MPASVLRILVVDDSDVVRRAICKILQAHADIEIVCEASNGRDAIRLAKEHEPDLVLMDISMPIVSGFEATRLIKHALPRIKVIFLTQHRSRSFMKEALAAGAHGFATKDNATRELIAEVRRVQTHQPEPLPEQDSDSARRSTARPAPRIREV
ncbi:MAG TPA: response regulator transcription factor [Terriglobales bacterium]|nr:response regulator transcription factor [Terriglobales bacterium]